ncbi:hypothetical protein RY831_14755 [Noviherbaspirillum sp. CPCC 100848]|uniref:Uncharacterized protein n=1 Tax=Noviherbaspirillum album TaxID=3080276 RepID=A0ABU6JA60_9BURK|nr:hypothetical protein [Noviherbaspirillum sp. CPCC 100848]MEC4720420.1 hypothetical protein [Noviherbaspirillum sp. CPCC 100848]
MKPQTTDVLNVGKAAPGAAVDANGIHDTEEEGVTICGIFAGRKIAPNLYAEDVANARWVIRSVEHQPFPKRVGEVMGSGGRFQAMRMNGDHVAMKRNLLEAACALV